MCKQPSDNSKRCFLQLGDLGSAFLLNDGVTWASPLPALKPRAPAPALSGRHMARVRTAVTPTAEGGRSPQLSPLGLFPAPAEPSLSSIPLSGALRPKNKASRPTTAETEENLQSSLL